MTEETYLAPNRPKICRKREKFKPSHYRTAPESPHRMKPGVNRPDDNPSLFPFPEGWYFVASRKAIEKKGLLQKTWLGEQIVAWSDRNGGVCVAEAVCPHLGAALGPATGGRVRNGCLICPLHGFEYDVTGQCVATPCAPAPKSARLRVFETYEILGLVFAWKGSGGRAPQWHLPAPPPDGGDWCEKRFWSVRFAGHPQETTENSVDLGHLRYLHGYDNVKTAAPVLTEGPYLKSCFDFTRSRVVAGVKRLTYDVSAVTHVHGLGYSFIEVCERSIGMETRLWVFATPVDSEMLEMTLVSQVRRLTRPGRPIVGMRFLPPRLRTRIMNRIILTAQKHDVLQDVVIWRNKSYRPRPMLCHSDGPVGKFRRYCKQFYPDGQFCYRSAAQGLCVRSRQ